MKYLLCLMALVLSGCCVNFPPYYDLNNESLNDLEVYRFKSDSLVEIKSNLTAGYYNAKYIVSTDNEVTLVTNNDKSEKNYIAYGVLIKSNDFAYAIFDDRSTESCSHFFGASGSRVCVYFETNRVFIKQDITGDHAVELLIEIYP